MRPDLMYDSLTGLSVGDALDAQFFMVGRSIPALVAGRPLAGPWQWTDRGYGIGAVIIPHKIRDGVPWRDAAGAAFNGQGSCGNGAAMRIAPLGAYFADDPELAVTQAKLSAEVTHMHPEGITGGVAVAVAAAEATRARDTGIQPRELLDAVLDRIDSGQTKRLITRARTLLRKSAEEAAYELCHGSRTAAQDTVPFTLWVAANFLDNYPAAITTCVQAGGDVDTTAAIVGGIVAAYTGEVPPNWLAAREPLPDWAAS